MTRYLMEDAIKSHQWQSLSDWPMTRYLMEDAIKSHQWQSELISGGGAYTYAPSGVIRGHQSGGTYMYSSPCGASSTRTWVVTC